MNPLLPKYSVSVEKTLVWVPLSAATSPRYFVMMFLYCAFIGWPAGCQKIGVTTTGPVESVPITGPPCQIRGGAPLAASSVLWAQGAPTGTALMTPRKWLLPIREPPHARADEDAPADPTAPTAIAAPATRNTNNFLIRKVPPPFRLQTGGISITSSSRSVAVHPSDAILPLKRV